MAPIGRRTFLAIAAAFTGSVLVSSFLSNGRYHSTVLKRLAAGADDVSRDLRELGLAVNRRSPMSVRRAIELKASQPEGPLSRVLVVASQADATQAPVIIDGWLLPDLLAGVAGAVALESLWS